MLRVCAKWKHLRRNPIRKQHKGMWNFFWNAGIFVWNVETITTAIRDYAPQIAEVMDRLEQALFTKREHEELKRLFLCVKKFLSIMP